MLVSPRTPVLTDLPLAGKIDGLRRSKHCMSTPHASSTGHRQVEGPPVDVVAWRARRLGESGFPAAVAKSLAAQSVDLHALLQLVDAGCPPELAARILAPADLAPAYLAPADLTPAP